MFFKLDLPKHQPRDNPLPLCMRIIYDITYIMPYTILIAIEDVIGTAGDVDSIDETVFTDGIGEVP